MKTTKQLLEEMRLHKEGTLVEVKKEKVRENYVLGETFKVGEFVTDGIVEGEIIYRGANYVTVLTETNDEHKMWLDNLSIIDGSHIKQKRNQIFKESFIFKGYKTKNFTRELAEEFRDLAKNSADQYGILGALKTYDFIMGVTEEQVVNQYPAVKMHLERAKRFSKRFVNIDERLTQIEEQCLRMALVEGFKFTTTDKMMVARVIAATAGSEEEGNEPSIIVNKALNKLRNAQLTPQGWELVGRMLKVASSAGIRWNRDMFSPSQLNMMKA